MKGIELLRSKTPELSDNEWMQIAEERRRIIAAKLDDFTLPRLSQSEMCIPVCSYITIEWLRKRERGVKLILPDGYPEGDVQGFFHYAPISTVQAAEKVGDAYRLYSWGMNRAGKWLLIRWDLAYEDGEPMRENYLREVTVEVTEVDLSTMLARSRETAARVCASLSGVIYGWERRRKETLHEIEEIANQFEKDDAAIACTIISEGGMMTRWPQRGPLP